MDRHATSTRTARLVLVLACAAEFMVVLDVSVVNVALRSIQVDLGFVARDLPWVANAYALAFAGLLLPGGRLADVLGLRRTVLLGLGLFAGASLVAGLAGTPGLLVAARAVQGLGAAVLSPATLTVLTTTFPEGRPRARAIAAWTAVAVAGGAAGNVLGGVLTELLSWRWVFLINVPLGVLAGAGALRVLEDARAGTRRPRLDAPGALLATVGIGAVTVAISRIGEDGSTAAPLVALGVGVGALAGLAAVERRAREPLLPTALVRLRRVSVGNAVTLLAGAALIPMWFFLSLSMRTTLGYSPLQTGLAFLPHTLLTIAVALLLAPRLMDRAPHRALVAVGLLIAAVGFLWQSRLQAGSGYVDGILGPAVLIALGGGILNTPLTSIATSGVRDEDAGAASGLLNAAKQVGGIVGLAALAVLAGGADGGAGAADGYGAAFLGIAGVLVVAAVATSALPRNAAPSAPRTGTG